MKDIATKATAAAALLTALALDAETVRSGNAAGYIDVTDTRQYVPLAVPFAATDEADKAFGELVLPDGIQTGDRLVAYREGRYKALTFVDGSGWQGILSAAEGESELVAGDPKEKAGLKPGDAFWLVRANANKTIRLAGVVPSDVRSGGYSGAVVEGESTLLANPRTTGFWVNAKGAIDGADEGDTIVIPRDGADTRYTYGVENGVRGWYEVAAVSGEITYIDAKGEKQTVTVNKREKRLVEDKIPAGTGFWYLRSKPDGKTAPKVNWVNG